MPSYNYECKSCGFDKELFQTFAEHEKFDKKCPDCGKELNQYFPMGTITPKVRVEDTSHGGIFSKNAWKRNKWT